MTGLTDMADGTRRTGDEIIAEARRAWEESMLRRVGELQADLRMRDPELLAVRVGGRPGEGGFELAYWGRQVAVNWPGLEARWLDDGAPCSTFDTAILTYYLHTADGAPPAGRWIGFRELPDGAFYHQAFQGYSGDRIAAAFGEHPEAFDKAALALDGQPLLELSTPAWSFRPLPRIQLAAVLWPGDEDFPARASVLFEASTPHYMPTDGLALLGSGLAGRLLTPKK